MNQRINKAVAILKAAIAEHGGPGVQWAADPEDIGAGFWEAWGQEIDDLLTWGDCEISGRYTASGNPVIVTMKEV